MGNDTLFIMSHQGLGDHIISSGIYRKFSESYNLVIVPTLYRNYFAVSDLLKDAEKIFVVPYRYEPAIEFHRDFLSQFGVKVLNLGFFGANSKTVPNNLRLDHWFYSQANLDLELRWNSFKYVRNHLKEDLLFNKIVGETSNYAFVHDDSKRNFKINESKISKNLKIIRPVPEMYKEYTPFHYLKIIENAKEIHCMESSFCAFIESVKINVPKFAHRYCRPEALHNFGHQFTYRSEWKVFLAK